MTNGKIVICLLIAIVIALGVVLNFLLTQPSISITEPVPKERKGQGLQVSENKSSTLAHPIESRNKTKSECKCPPSPMSIIFREGFEYEDSVTNHSWVTIDPANIEQTQSKVVAEGNRALILIRLQDQAYVTDTYTYSRSFNPQRGDFQVDFYIRSSSYDQYVGVLFKGDGKGIFAGFRDGGRQFVIHHDSLQTGFPRYELDQWYHIRLMIRTVQGNLDAYINNMSIPVASNLYFSDSYFDTLSLHAFSGSGAISYFDGIIIRGYHD